MSTNACLHTKILFARKVCDQNITIKFSTINVDKFPWFSTFPHSYIVVVYRQSINKK